MNKEQIKKRLSEIRSEMQELEAKLNQPEKWEPKGGEWRITASCTNRDYLKYCNDPDIQNEEKPFRTQTKEQAKDMVKHIKNQVLLKQLANELNGDWVPDWDDGQEPKFRPHYACDSKKWNYATVYQYNTSSPVIRSEKYVKKVCDILNNMETGIEL